MSKTVIVSAEDLAIGLSCPRQLTFFTFTRGPPPIPHSRFFYVHQPHRADARGANAPPRQPRCPDTGSSPTTRASVIGHHQRDRQTATCGPEST